MTIGRLLAVTPSGTVDIFGVPADILALRFILGGTPSVPEAGEIWIDSTGLFAQINGVTRQLALVEREPAEQVAQHYAEREGVHHDILGREVRASERIESCSRG